MVHVNSLFGDSGQLVNGEYWTTTADELTNAI